MNDACWHIPAMTRGYPDAKPDTVLKKRGPTAPLPSLDIESGDLIA